MVQTKSPGAVRAHRTEAYGLLIINVCPKKLHLVGGKSAYYEPRSSFVFFVSGRWLAIVVEVKTRVEVK
jgi:hypothetical protein